MTLTWEHSQLASVDLNQTPTGDRASSFNSFYHNGSCGLPCMHRKKIPKFLFSKISYEKLHVKKKKCRIKIFLRFAYNLLRRSNEVRLAKKMNEFLLGYPKLENEDFLYFIVCHWFSDGIHRLSYCIHSNYFHFVNP